MNDKIENNPSFKKFNEEIKGVKAIRQIATILSPISKTAKSISKSLEKVIELENKFRILSKSPDEFNLLFAESGWIAHESMNHQLMLDCIELAKSNNAIKGEEKLADYYTSDNLRWLTMPLKFTDGFSKRYSLIKLAYEETIQKRFYSAVPLLLMIIDGSVNDIDKNKGFFTETTDLTAWDSIAAHSTGLTKIRDVFNETRKKTNEEEIFLPYRNGILHGRDLNYSNKYVTGKCWLTLIAINDWIVAIKNGKKNRPKEEPKLSLKESVEDLKHTISAFNKHQKEMDEINTFIESWCPRNFKVDVDIPKVGNVLDYADFTPEKDAVRFITNWSNRNYGAIAKQIAYFYKNVNLGKESGRVRTVFENRILKSFEILSVVDCAPAISEVYLKVYIEYLQKEYDFEIKMRMIYQDENGKSMVLGQNGGEWKFIDSFFFHKIEYPDLI